MGYSGLGMQNWIYKRKLHKPFTKRGKVPTFHSLPKHSRTFKLKPTIKTNKRLFGFKIICIIIVLGFFTYTFSTKFIAHEKVYNQSSKNGTVYKNEIAFDFLLNSGISRLSRNNVSGAYSEFVLAYRIKPENEQVINLLIETTSILCKKQADYCIELEKFLDK